MDHTIEAFRSDVEVLRQSIKMPFGVKNNQIELMIHIDKQIVNPLSG